MNPSMDSPNEITVAGKLIKGLLIYKKCALRAMQTHQTICFMIMDQSLRAFVLPQRFSSGQPGLDVYKRQVCTSPV